VARAAGGRRAVAPARPFEHVYDPAETDPAEVVEEVTDGWGADVHVETTGAVGATYPAIERSLAETANVVHISNAGEVAPVETRRYQASAAQLYGSEGHTGDRVFQEGIRLMAAGRLDNRPVVTATYGLAEADEAVRRVAERVDGKVVIEMP